MATTSNLAIDPTDPAQAQVKGIAVPTQATVDPSLAHTPPVVTSPTPVPSPTGGIAPQTPYPTATQATQGVTPYTPPPEDLPALQDTSVANRVAQLTGQDSPLMQQARTAGLQAANARGVANSSIAAGASENAAITAATPIAQQEASQAAASNQQRYNLAATMDQLAANAGFNSQAAAQQYSYSAALNTGSYAFQAQQQANQNAFQQQMAGINQGYSVDLANLQSTLQSKLQSQANNEQIQRMGVDLANQLELQSNQASNALNQISAQGDIQLKEQANQFTEAMKELTLNLNEQNSVAAANAAVNLFNAQMGLRSALLSNTTMPAAERSTYEAQIATMTQPIQNYVSQLLGYVPPTSTTAPTTAPATTAPATTAPTGGIAPTGPTGDGLNQLNQFV